MHNHVYGQTVILLLRRFFFRLCCQTIMYLRKKRIENEKVSLDILKGYDRENINATQFAYDEITSLSDPIVNAATRVMEANASKKLLFLFNHVENTQVSINMLVVTIPCCGSKNESASFL